MIQHFKILKEKVLQKNKKFINIEILKNKSFIKLSANNKQFEKWIFRNDNLLNIINDKNNLLSRKWEYINESSSVVIHLSELDKRVFQFSLVDEIFILFEESVGNDSILFLNEEKFKQKFKLNENLNYDNLIEQILFNCSYINEEVHLNDEIHSDKAYNDSQHLNKLNEEIIFLKKELLIRDNVINSEVDSFLNQIIFDSNNNVFVSFEEITVFNNFVEKNNKLIEDNLNSKFENNNISRQKLDESLLNAKSISVVSVLKNNGIYIEFFDNKKKVTFGSILSFKNGARIRKGNLIFIDVNNFEKVVLKCRNEYVVKNISDLQFIKNDPLFNNFDFNEVLKVSKLYFK